LAQLFDRWLDPSEKLRQYLAALGNEQIEIARQLISIVPANRILAILEYLIEDLWHRRAGWPDLLVHRENEIMFAEVQAAGSKLGENKERWIRDNYERLHFPFKLVSVLKKERHRAVA
jgi:hypothetical protein